MSGFHVRKRSVTGAAPQRSGALLPAVGASPAAPEPRTFRIFVTFDLAQLDSFPAVSAKPLQALVHTDLSASSRSIKSFHRIFKLCQCLPNSMRYFDDSFENLHHAFEISPESITLTLAEFP